MRSCVKKKNSSIIFDLILQFFKFFIAFTSEWEGGKGISLMKARHLGSFLWVKGRIKMISEQSLNAGFWWLWGVFVKRRQLRHCIGGLICGVDGLVRTLAWINLFTVNFDFLWIIFCWQLLMEFFRLGVGFNFRLGSLPLFSILTASL